MVELFNSDTDSWALHNLPYFRELGFYSDLNALSDLGVLAEIKRRYAEKYFPNSSADDVEREPWTIRLAPPLADLWLLEFDESRTWWQDTECIYPPYELAYAAAISSWATISRGAFVPTEICETWNGTEDFPESPNVRVRLPHGTLTLEPIVQDDWFDLTIIVPINHCIRDNGIRFELLQQFDQTAFVVALRADERAELQRTRGWTFHLFGEQLKPKW